MLVDFAPYLFRGRHRWVPDATERHRPRQRHLRRRPGARLRRVAAALTRTFRGRDDAVTIEEMDPVWVRSARSAPGAATPSKSACHSARRARGADCRRAERGGGGKPRAGTRGDRSGEGLRADRGRGVAADDRCATGGPRGARTRRCRHPVRTAAAGRARRPHGHRRCRRATQNPLRAHGWGHARTS